MRLDISPGNELPAGDGSPRSLHEADTLLTVREVAALLKVPVSWVYERTRRRSQDRIPGFRLGKYWRFNAEEVRRWLEGQKG